MDVPIEPAPPEELPPLGLRIPGFGGAVLKMTLIPLSDRSPDREVVRLGVDITIVDPNRLVCYRGRRADSAQFAELADFLRHAMSDVAPQASADTFTMTSAGFMLSIPTSDDFKIDLLTSVIIDLDDEIADYDQTQFTTNRATLWAAIESAEAIAAAYRHEPPTPKLARRGTPKSKPKSKSNPRGCTKP